MRQATIDLNDGHTIPQLGFGTWQITDDSAAEIVGHALATGYRHVDTARAYRNEAGVGGAVRAAEVPREEIFVTSKLPNDSHGRDATLRAFDATMAALGLDRLDLYLIHWPIPMQGKYVETWRAMIGLRDEGRIVSIGVSNFEEAHVRRLIDETGVTPAVNQIELHPTFQQREARDWNRELGIAIESWSPLGQGQALRDPKVAAIAEKHGKAPGQVVLRWHLDQGLIVIPRSTNPAHIDANFDVADFTLDADDMDALAAMDDPEGGRIGPKLSEMGPD